MAAVSRQIGLRAKGLGLILGLALSLQPSALFAQARRIISIIPSTTEMLFAMGAGDRVIAIGTYDKYPPEAQKLPRVGALVDPNVEQILQMRPDLVVVYGTQTELKRRLERANIPYYSYSHQGLPDIFSTMRSLGMRVGMAAQGEALAARLERQLAAIRAKVANRPRPKTLLVMGREPGALRNIYASGGVGFLHDMLEAAGGTDALADIQRQSVDVSNEMVLARAPDVIIELRYTDEAINRADLDVWNRVSAVPAVKNHRVIVLTGDQFVVPGPRVADAVAKMAAAIHPEVGW
ncbi:MAG TPA: helical backbone metal receptor [Vicinamibacterales bacterium]|nr:helical backbone metal receptor [Vicinamibacterales bacterium]